MLQHSLCAAAGFTHAGSLICCVSAELPLWLLTARLSAFPLAALCVQSVEEEQEQFGERQQQQRKDIQQVRASIEQQSEQLRSSTGSVAAAGTHIRQVSSGRQRVATGASNAAAASSKAHSNSGAVCTLPPGFALPDMASMIPTSISEPEAQHSRHASAHAGPSSILEQQALQRQPSADTTADRLPAGSDSTGLLAGPQDSSRDQLAGDLAELVGRVRALEEQQEQAEDVPARLQALEEQFEDVRPLDAMTCGAVEARLSVLEDDSSERKEQLQVCRLCTYHSAHGYGLCTLQQCNSMLCTHYAELQARYSHVSLCCRCPDLLQEAQEQLDEVRVQLETLRWQINSSSDNQQRSVLQEQANATSAPLVGADLAERIASLEEQQQDLKELAQRLEAAQQQLASNGGSYTSLDSQPSSVKER